MHAGPVNSAVHATQSILRIPIALSRHTGPDLSCLLWTTLSGGIFLVRRPLIPCSRMASVFVSRGTRHFRLIYRHLGLIAILACPPNWEKANGAIFSLHDRHVRSSRARFDRRVLPTSRRRASFGDIEHAPPRTGLR
nr:hypothetical protein CFP56_52270 [Quercus suber]